MALTIGVPREVFPGEKRVATVPEVVEKLIKLGFGVAVESGAGEAANFPDDAYRAAGAEIVATASGLWSKADVVFKVRPPSPAEVAMLRAVRTGYVFSLETEDNNVSSLSARIEGYPSSEHLLFPILLPGKSGNAWDFYEYYSESLPSGKLRVLLSDLYLTGETKGWTMEWQP